MLVYGTPGYEDKTPFLAGYPYASLKLGGFVIKRIPGVIHGLGHTHSLGARNQAPDDIGEWLNKIPLLKQRFPDSC